MKCQSWSNDRWAKVRPPSVTLEPLIVSIINDMNIEEIYVVRCRGRIQGGRVAGRPAPFPVMDANKDKVSRYQL